MKTHGNRVQKSLVAPMITIAALVASALTACAPAPNSGMDSNRSMATGTAGGHLASNSSSPVTSSGVPHIPLRIGRDFFERQLQGRVEVHTTEVQRDLGSTVSPIVWEEGAPVGASPEAGAIADFRDRPGCAKLTEQGALQVCFVVVPDVSSLDVTAEKVSLQGFESMAKGCSGSPDKVKFVTGHKGANSLDLSFVAEYGTRCSPQMIEVQLQAQ